jgi:hypothetical protein
MLHIKGDTLVSNPLFMRLGAHPKHEALSKELITQVAKKNQKQATN